MRRLLFLVFIVLLPSAAHAEAAYSFSLSFIAPSQTSPVHSDVDGFRFNLITGLNENVDGIDLGMVNQVKRDFSGFELGVIANNVGNCVNGVQMAVFYNNADTELHGLQLGIVNHAGSINGGVQIGILNFNDDHKEKGFMPFINAAF